MDEKAIQAAESLHAAFNASNFHIIRNASEVNTPPEGSDFEDLVHKDPVIVRDELNAQIASSYFKRLKFQYLEQNAKDRYIKTIISDIDDTPLVSDEDNRIQYAENLKRKEKLKAAKTRLEDVHNNIRQLAPSVEQDYIEVKQATEQATVLAKKILDARLALSRLRQAHPQPRLTVQSADEKLVEQVEEMQVLTDQIEKVQVEVQGLKEMVNKGIIEVEELRVQRAEVERSVKMKEDDSEDDGRLVPLYEWFTASLALHQSIHRLEDIQVASQNELRLKYLIDTPEPPSFFITITLIFIAGTRQLSTARIDGLEERGIDMGEVIEAHVQVNDLHGLLAAILARARQGY